LVPGEVGRIAIIAADRKQARTIFGYIVGFLENVPMLSGMIVRRTQDTIDLANGLTIEIQAASFRTIRGYSLVACLADEVAFWMTDEGSSNPDVEIIRSIRPALASIRDSMLLVASSPYAEAGALWNAYRKHHGKDDSHVLTWQAPTRTMNPSIPQSVVDEAYETDPASASAEFGAQFRSDISSFIPRDVVERAVDIGISTRQPVPGTSYQCFFDAASGVGTDRFAAAWGHRENEKIIIDHVFVHKPPFDASQVFAEFAAICRNFGTTDVCSDRYSIGFLISECQRNGLTHKPSDLDKSRLYLHALPQLTSGRVRLPDVPEIVTEFCSLERRTGSEGRDKVDARGGKPEDVANAISGCVWLLSQPMSSADGWIEFYRKQAQEMGLDVDRIEAGFNSWDVDVDDLRASAPHGWDFHRAEDWISVKVPPALVPDGKMNFGGRQYCFSKRVGTDVCFDCHRDDLRALLRHPAWRACNASLAESLGIEVAAS
jgi:hypothetical protein